MSEWIIETRYLDPSRSSQITVGRASGRIRSRSEIYSIDISAVDSDGPDSRKNSEDGKIWNMASPTFSYGDTPNNQGDKSSDCGEVLSGTYVSEGSRHSLRTSSETRGRLFSELAISDLPTESVFDNAFSLDIYLPCNYDENLELRAQSIMHIRQATIKRVVIRSGAKLARYNIVYTKDHFYWPQETIRHCRTGRIKRGMVLKRQFGVYQPDKTKELIALKVMEKNAISESLQFDEDDVQTELNVMKQLSECGRHENILYLHDCLETNEYLIAVMELVDGDLYDLLRSVKDQATAMDIFSQILKGYQYLVQHGYYHCDLSLENVAIKLIPNYNQTGKARMVAKLSDFGRVRKIGDTSTIIEDDEIAGKPYYLAPEAYVGSYEAGPADIWSLGIILFILLTGSPPFGIANDSDEAFELFICEGFDYLLPALQSAHVEPAIIELLRCLLNVNPTKRLTLSELLVNPLLSL